MKPRVLSLFWAESDVEGGRPMFHVSIGNAGHNVSITPDDVQNFLLEITALTIRYSDKLVILDGKV